MNLQLIIKTTIIILILMMLIVVFLLRWKITVLLVVTVSVVECYALFISDLAQI